MHHHLVIDVIGDAFADIYCYLEAGMPKAERERRAKVIHAEGELQASEKLQQAASVLAREPGAMQLRYLQTLAGMASDRSSLVVFPLPVDLIDGLRGAQARNTK